MLLLETPPTQRRRKHPARHERINSTAIACFTTPTFAGYRNGAPHYRCRNIPLCRHHFWFERNMGNPLQVIIVHLPWSPLPLSIVRRFSRYISVLHFLDSRRTDMKLGNSCIGCVETVRPPKYLRGISSRFGNSRFSPQQCTQVPVSCIWTDRAINVQRSGNVLFLNSRCWAPMQHLSSQDSPNHNGKGRFRPAYSTHLFLSLGT